MNARDLEEIVRRAGMLAIAYYGEIQMDDPGYDIERDVDICVDGLDVAGWPADEVVTLRRHIRDTIIDPTTHREVLVDFVASRDAPVRR